MKKLTLFSLSVLLGFGLTSCDGLLKDLTVDIKLKDFSLLFTPTISTGSLPGGDETKASIPDLDQVVLPFDANEQMSLSKFDDLKDYTGHADKIKSFKSGRSTLLFGETLHGKTVSTLSIAMIPDDGNGFVINDLAITEEEYEHPNLTAFVNAVMNRIIQGESVTVSISGGIKANQFDINDLVAGIILSIKLNIRDASVKAAVL